jgi:CubicO group peptidase (beta-lactamase class C family)
MTGSLRLRAVLALTVPLCACATPSPPGRGLSSAGLARIEKAVSADVDRGRIPGVVMMVQRDGRLVYSKTIGKQDPASGAPMKDDSIFRIYSMTKPIASAGVMMLVEEGRVALSDPVAKYLPELKDLKVGVEKDGKLDIVAAQRQPPA